jgi:hypothetical protein
VNIGFLPILRRPWREVERRTDGSRYLNELTGQSVIVSLEEHNGTKWLHVSTAFPTKLPSWFELREVKDLFIGRNREAVQVLPPEKEYVNLHPYCLHLWARVDGTRLLPDFTQGGSSL